MRWLTFLAVALLPAGAAVGQVPGDQLFTIRTARLKVNADVVGTVPRGYLLTIDRVNGPWLWVTHDGRKGWLHEQNVIAARIGVDYWTQAIALNPGDHIAYFARGWIRQVQGETAASIEDYNRAIRLASDRPDYYNNRGTAKTDTGDLDGAVSDFSEAIRLDPDYLQAYNNRANAYSAKGQFDKALADYDKAVELGPHHATAYYNRAGARFFQGDYARALADYDKAIELDKKFASAYNSAAWLMATCPEERFRDGAKAIKYATKVCEMSSWKDLAGLDTLAAAYAESGDFAAAVKYQQQVVDLLPESERPPFQARLELYKAEKPFREQP